MARGPRCSIRLLTRSATAPGGLDEDGLRRLVEIATRANGAGLPDDVALLALNVDRGSG